VRYVEKFIPLIFRFNAGQDCVDSIRILFERLPLWLIVNTVIIGRIDHLVYLLELQGDPLLSWFQVIPGGKMLADVDERHAYTVIRVTSTLPNYVCNGVTDVPLKTRTVARRLRPRSTYWSPSPLVLTPPSSPVVSFPFFCFLGGCV